MEGRRVLFQGDSVTDTERNREFQSMPNSRSGMGSGYAMMVAAEVLTTRPGTYDEFFNAGQSGNRVIDLYARWKTDTLKLKPDLISILIGVNDTWHGFNEENPNGIEPDRYETIYRLLLEWTRAELPGTDIVLCEPFVLECGVVNGDWIDEMKQRQDIVRGLAAEFNCPFVRFQSMFTELSTQAPEDFWLPDGVHPSIAGHKKMAELWLDTVWNY